MALKLSAWAKKNGMSYATAYRWFKSGKLNAAQVSTGTILVNEESDDNNVNKDVQYKLIVADILTQAADYTINNKSSIYFARWILDNYKLEPINKVNKEKKKDISTHFNNILQGIDGWANQKALKEKVLFQKGELPLSESSEEETSKYLSEIIEAEFSGEGE